MTENFNSDVLSSTYPARFISRRTVPGVVLRGRAHDKFRYVLKLAAAFMAPPDGRVADHRRVNTDRARLLFAVQIAANPAAFAKRISREATILRALKPFPQMLLAWLNFVPGAKLAAGNFIARLPASWPACAPS